MDSDQQESTPQLLREVEFQPLSDQMVDLKSLENQKLAEQKDQLLSKLATIEN